jgi:ABC-type glycerol-3-phosphate transport system permease component
MPYSRMAKLSILLLSTIPFLYPFVFVAATAFKPQTEFAQSSIAWPHHPTFQNISAAWSEGSLGRSMFNSLIAVGVASAVTVVISAMAAYWFLHHRGRIASVLRVAVIGSLAVPAPVFVIPLFVLLGQHHLTNNLIVLGLVYAAWNAGFGVFLMYQYYRGIPHELHEAAMLDGASFTGRFYRVVLPLSKPALATLGALAFLWSWSDLLVAVILIQDPARRPVTAAVALLSNSAYTPTVILAAAVLISLIPGLVVFGVGQRYIKQGIVAGFDR